MKFAILRYVGAAEQAGGDGAAAPAFAVRDHEFARIQFDGTG